MADRRRSAGKEPAPALPVNGRGRFAGVMVALCALLVGGLVLNVTVGTVAIPVGDVFSMLWDGLRYNVGNLFTRGAYSRLLYELVHGDTKHQILFSIRLPRLLLAAILGGALSVSGYLLQVFFRNPIAGPFELGISSGAKMVVGITLIFLAPRLGSIRPLTLVGAAFLGSLMITCVVLMFSQRVNNMSMLLVIGIMVGYLCSAVTDFCITFADDHDIANLTNWSMGSFSGANWLHVKTAAVVCLLGLVAALLLSKPMGAYAMGEGYAGSMGINVRLFRLLLILLSSVLSACVTAFAGPISFVGVAVPHITRTVLKSARPTRMIPATFLCGGVFCTLCDLIARTALAPTELKVGTVTSVFGAPIVIYMMVNRNKWKED